MSGQIVHGGGVTAAARLYGGKPEDWLDLSTGINPNPVALPGIPASAWHRLPDQYLSEQAREAARHYYRSGQILPLPVPGTQSVIQLLPRLLEPGREIAIISPTYAEYARAFETAGFAVDMLGDIESIRDHHALVVVVNPNNPDGRVVSVDRLRALHAELRGRGGLLLVDEAFGDTSPASSLAPYAADLPGLIIFRSFGKFFGLAGLRLGFVIAKGSILDQFEEWLGPWSVSGPALSIAVSLLAQDPIAIARRIRARRAGLEKVLVAAGLAVAGGTDLFALVADRRARDIYAHLAGHHILVRKFDYAAHWLRFGLAPDEIGDQKLAQALSEFA
jgi:cobalamin biosynthetic protein CobC